MSVNKNPGSRDDNRGNNRFSSGDKAGQFDKTAQNTDRVKQNIDREKAQEIDQKPSADRDSDEYWTGGTAGQAKARSNAERAPADGPTSPQIGHPNRTTGQKGGGNSDL